MEGIDRWGGGGVQKGFKRSEEVKSDGRRATEVSDEEGDKGEGRVIGGTAEAGASERW